MAATVKLRLVDLEGSNQTGPQTIPVQPMGPSQASLLGRSAHCSIPHPREGMKLGECEIMPFKGGENIAQYVAYVQRMTSSAEAIESIGRLGEFTRAQAICQPDAAPLLGEGAGWDKRKRGGGT